MTAQISPMLAVADGPAAIEFYKAAFGAAVDWQVGEGIDIVAGLRIEGAQIFLATQSPEFGTRSPGAVGFTTVRIELFVNDPVAVHSRAVKAGAVERDPVTEHEYPTVGPRPIKKMLQGSLLDPSGHMWLIGKFLD